MPNFGTFSLAEVLNNANAIKGFQQQSYLDELRQIATSDQIRFGREDRERENAAVSEKQQQSNRLWVLAATDQILQSDDPVALANHFLPEAKRRGVISPEINSADGLDLNEINALNQQVRLLVADLDTQSPETDVVNFSDADGRVKISTIKGSPEFHRAVKDPNLFATGNVSQRQQIEQGEPGSFDGRTKPQVGQDVQHFQNQAIAAAQSISTSADLLSIAQQNPAALGTPGGIARLGNNAIQTAVSLGGMLGIDVSNPPRFDKFDYGQLRGTAIDSTEFQSGIFNIAFAAAVAEQGTRPTDKDIQAFIDQIAGSTSDPAAFAKTVQSFNQRLDRRIRSIARIKGIPKEVQDAVFAEMDAALARTDQFFGQQSLARQIPGFDKLTPAEQAELEERLRARDGR